MNQKSAWTRRTALLALMLALSPACRSDDAAAQSPVPASGPAPAERTNGDVPPAKATVSPTPSAGVPRSRPPRPTHPTLDQRIDESVHRLTRNLDLNPEQQAKLRQILMDQHRQMMELRTQSLDPGADRAALSLAVLDRTRERIRSMLNEEQKKKYTTDVPRDQAAPAQADLKHWMGIQEENRRKGDGASK